MSLDVDPESLAQAGSRLGTVAEQMAGELQQLQTAVTGSGNPWGGDEQGTLFAGIYGAVLNHAIGSLASYVEQVGYAAAGLAQQSRAHVQTDDGAAERFSGFGG